MATAKKAATATGRKVAHRKAVRDAAIQQEMNKRAAVADLLAKAVTTNRTKKGKSR